MPKLPRRRIATGNRRRLPVRRTSNNRRHMALSHQQIGFMMALQCQMANHGYHFMASLFPLYITLGMYSLVASNPILFHAIGNQETTFAGLAGVAVANSMYHFSQFISCYCLDYQLHDITPQEEEELMPFQPKKNISLYTWSDQECYNKTGFNKCKLERIYDCFGLIALADEGDGQIWILTGAIYIFGMPCCYTFIPNSCFYIS